MKKTKRIGAVLAAALCGLGASAGTALAGGDAAGEWFAPQQQLLSHELAEQSGRQGVSITSLASTEAVLAGNSVSGHSVNTGTNTISDDAFANFAGVGSVLMNSGNNVVMEHVTIVNVILN
jgi:hypothetical protein